MKVIGIEPFERPVLHQLKWPGKYERTTGKKPPTIEKMSGKEFFAPGSGAIGVDFPHLHSAATLCDDIVLISRKEMSTALKELERKGFSVGHTSAMSYVVAKQLDKRIKGKTLVGIFYDLLDRY